VEAMMFTFPQTVQVYMAVDPTDMRKSFDSLAGATQNVMGQNPLSGHLFVFFNRERNRVKVLFWDKSGYCLYYKRLEQGTFHFPQYLSEDTKVLKVAISDFALILAGIDLYSAVRRERYALS
jgi:transposase